MAHWFFHILFVLLVCALLGAMGGGLFYLYRDDQAQRSVAAQAPVLAKALTDLRDLDAAAATADAKQCSSLSGKSFTDGMKVGRSSMFTPRTSLHVQSMFDAQTLREALGQAR